MPRIKRKPEAIAADTLEFLIHARKAIHEDPQTRMIYAAMTYHLPATIVSVAQELGILRRAGWNWHWTSGIPSKKMAGQLIERMGARSTQYGRQYRTASSNMRAYKG